MQVWRQHYEESFVKMEALYQLLQQQVEQDMEEFWAEHARQIAQQTQSLQETLQKGIANVITIQLMPVYIELTTMHTRAVEVDALVAQMAQAKALKSELEEKVLEIEEKEDNHIAYLEA